MAKELTQTLNKLFAKHLKGSQGWEDHAQNKWLPEDIFQRVVQTALEKTSLESVCNTIPGCSADLALLHMKILNYSQTVIQLNAMLKEIVYSLKLPKQTRLTVSIDITDYPYYGDRTSELCVGSKAKDGTTYFDRYFTAYLQLGNYYLPLYIHSILQTEGVKPGDLVKAFLKEVSPWCPFSRLLADAYFSTATVLKLLKRHHLKYIMNMRHYSVVKEAIATIQETQYLLTEFNGLDVSNDRFVYR